jgi:hypothetical protein
MKIEILSSALLVLLGTGLLARVATQGVEQALFSSVIELWLNRKKRN